MFLSPRLRYRQHGNRNDVLRWIYDCWIDSISFELAIIAIRSWQVNEWKTIDRCILQSMLSLIYVIPLRFSCTLAANASDIVQADRINAHFPRSTLAFRCSRNCNSRLTSWRNSVHDFATQTLCNPVSKFRRVDASSSDNGATRATWRDCD